MSRPILRWLIASFTALVITISLYNSASWRENLRHSGPFHTGQQQSQSITVDSPWAKLPLRYPVESYALLPSEPPLQIPRIQHSFDDETAAAKSTREKRLEQIRESFQHAWSGYKEHAWMKDELKPISGSHDDTFGGWAATLVDSLDTLWIMGFKEDFDEAVAATVQINFSNVTQDTINVFETTIRYLGGFLAAYDLSGRHELLVKAVELGEMLYMAFDTPNRLPITRWKWETTLRGEEVEPESLCISAEVGSLSLEFTRLSQLSGDMKYYDAITRITQVFYESQTKTLLPGIWPITISTRDADFTEQRRFSFGAMADSVYEYLPKMFSLLGGHGDQYQDMYELAIEAAKKDLFFRPVVPNADILISGNAMVIEEGKPQLEAEFQHLVCFAGGMVGMGARLFGRSEDLKVARKLADGCIWAYESTATGIMPEAFQVRPCEDPDNCDWDDERWKKEEEYKSGSPHGSTIKKNYPHGIVGVRDRRYMLRPEAIESVFIMYRITGDAELMEKGWKMFEAIERYTRTKIAHAMLEDVFDPAGGQQDKMESFWTAETLKYFYLLFSEPSVMSLDNWVLNTEAHGFRRPDSTEKMPSKKR